MLSIGPTCSWSVVMVGRSGPQVFRELHLKQTCSQAQFVDMVLHRVLRCPFLFAVVLFQVAMFDGSVTVDCRHRHVDPRSTFFGGGADETSSWRRTI